MKQSYFGPYFKNKLLGNNRPILGKGPSTCPLGNFQELQAGTLNCRHTRHHHKNMSSRHTHWSLERRLTTMAPACRSELGELRAKPSNDVGSAVKRRRIADRGWDLKVAADRWRRRFAEMIPIDNIALGSPKLKLSRSSRPLTSQTALRQSSAGVGSSKKRPSWPVL